MKLTSQHWIILSGCLVSIGAMVAAVSSWNAVLSPPFVGGVLGVFGANIAAIYAPRPQAWSLWQKNRASKKPSSASGGW